MREIRLSLISYNFLKKLFDTVSKYVSPSFVTKNPQDIGLMLNINAVETQKIFLDLHQKGLVYVYKGFNDMNITIDGIDFIEKKENDIAQKSKKAWDISKHEYEDLIEAGKTFNPRYKHYLYVFDIEKQDTDTFTAKMYVQKSVSGLPQFFSNKEHSNAIINDLKRGRQNFFTTNKVTFYQIIDFTIGSDEVYDFTFQKLSKQKNMKNDSNFTINNGNNSPIQIQSNSQNSHQELIIQNSDTQRVIDELKSKMSELEKHLEEKQKNNLVFAVEYLEEELREKPNVETTGIRKRITDIVKSIPQEAIKSILTEGTTSFLGF